MAAVAARLDAGLLLDLDGALVDIDAAEESARLQRVPHPLLLVLCKRCWFTTIAAKRTRPTPRRSRAPS